MRLWHEALLPFLPRQQLLGQHREVCALRGLGWGKPHSVVNYVFKHPYGWLVAYHFRVTDEMRRRGYKTDRAWNYIAYRGKRCPALSGEELYSAEFTCKEGYLKDGYIYPEHDDAYLRECLENLAGKGIHIDMAGN